MERPLTHQRRWAGTHLVLGWLTAVLVTLRLTGSLQPVGPWVSWGLGLVCLGLLLAAQAADWLDGLERVLGLLLGLSCLAAVTEWSGPWTVIELAALIGLFAVASAALETLQFGATGRLSAGLSAATRFAANSEASETRWSISRSDLLAPAEDLLTPGNDPPATVARNHPDGLAATLPLTAARGTSDCGDSAQSANRLSVDLEAVDLGIGRAQSRLDGGQHPPSPLMQAEQQHLELRRDEELKSEILPGEFGSEEFLDDIEMAGSDVVPNEHARQWTTRSEADGEDRIEGWCRVGFEVGQKTATLHLPFAPPFDAVPEVECEPLDCLSDITTRAVEIRTFGVRIEVRRSKAEDAEAVTVGYSAISDVRSSDAA